MSAPTRVSTSATTERPGSAPQAPLSTAAAARVVAARELAVTLRDRAFLFSTLFGLVVILLAVGLPAVLGGRTEQVRVAVVDAAGERVVDDADARAEAAPPPGEDPAVALEAVRVEDVAAAEAALRDDAADVALVPAPGGGAADPAGALVGLEDVPDRAAAVLAEAAGAARAAVVSEELGATQAQVEALQPGPLPTRTLEEGGDESLTFLVSMAFALLFFTTAFGFGMLIAQRVTEEKQSRVVELLVAAVPVRALLVGKVAGAGLLALGQVVLTVGVGAAGAALSGQGPVLSAIARASGWFVVFFLAGFVMLACLFAAAGAMAPRTEDLQSTTMPLNLAVSLPFFAAVFVTEEGPLLTTMAYLPLTSPLVMPRLLALGDATAWQALLSLALLVATAAALVVLGTRLYERSLLRTRGRGSWRTALRADAR